MHKEPGKIDVSTKRRPKFWLSFGPGIIGAGFFGFLAFAFIEFLEQSQSQPQLFALLIVPVVGLILSWRWPLASGILLVVGGFTPYIGIMFITNVGNDPMLGFFVIAIAIFVSVPLLISGILFILKGIGKRRVR